MPLVARSRASTRVRCRWPSLTVLLAAAACASGTAPPVEYLRASVDGVAWEAGSWNHYPIDGLLHDSFGNVFFAVQGTGVLGADRLQIGLYIPAAEGTHSLASTATSGFVLYLVFGGATTGFADTMFEPDSLQPGTVTLTHWNTTERIIEGTFGLRGRELGGTRVMSVAAGEFRIHYDAPPSGTAMHLPPNPELELTRCSPRIKPVRGAEAGAGS